MQPLHIELQDIADAIAMGQQAPHRSLAVSHIQAGGVVNVTRNGAPVGQASTVEELDALLA
jgi:hypothetical protein